MTANRLNNYLDRQIDLDFVTRDGEANTLYNVVLTGEIDTWGKYTVQPVNSADCYYLFPDEINAVRILREGR